MVRILNDRNLVCEWFVASDSQAGKPLRAGVRSSGYHPVVLRRQELRQPYDKLSHTFDEQNLKH